MNVFSTSVLRVVCPAFGPRNLAELLTRFTSAYRYIVFEIPANLLTKWIGPGKAIPLYTVSFGVLSVAFAFVRNKAAANAVRFLLGVAEAGKLL